MSIKNVMVALVCSISLGANLGAMDKHTSPKKSTVIVMDMDDVMSIKHKPGKLSFMPLVARAAFWDPSIVTAFFNKEQIKKDSKPIIESTNGATNTVHKILQKLKDEGYGDLFSYEDEIVAASTNPEPMPGMQEAIQNLKDQGYIVIGATNQDWKQHLAYRKKMQEQGVDLNTLFDAVLATRVNHEDPHQQIPVGFYRPDLDHNLYAATHEESFKPHNPYYGVVKNLAEYVATLHNTPIEKIIFTDDNIKNVEAAEKADLSAIQFGRSLRSSDGAHASFVKRWKRDMAKHLQ